MYRQSQSSYHVINERRYQLLSVCLWNCSPFGCSAIVLPVLHVHRLQWDVPSCQPLFHTNTNVVCVNSVDNFCYRCGELILTKKKKWTVEYPNISSATHPLSLCEGVPIPEPPKIFPRPWWGRGNVPQETLRPSTSRDLEYLFNIRWTTDRTFWPHHGPKHVEE